MVLRQLRGLSDACWSRRDGLRCELTAGHLAMRRGRGPRRVGGRVVTRELWHRGRLSLEFKRADLWVGAFYTDDDVWVCVLPCLPIHWRRR